MNDTDVKKRPVIGITTGEITNKHESWSPTTFGQSRTYVESVIRAGGVPLLLPLSADKALLEQLVSMLDGLYLAGGDDIHPGRYGQEPYLNESNYSPLRDEAELALLELALAKDLPILGICRGMQLLNVYYGGDLYQDLPTDAPGGLDHNWSTKQKTLVDLSHTLRLDSASKLAAVVGDAEIGANAHHHQAIRALGDGLVATSWASDDIIESIERPDYPFMVGVQAHPESLIDVEPRWLGLFTAFVDAASA